MVARRIIAVSADRDFAQQLAAALAGVADAIDVHDSFGAVDDADRDGALCVFHLGEDRALPAWSAACPVIVVLPQLELATVVELLQSATRIAGVISMDAFDPQQLAVMARRIVADDVFGISQVLAPGTEIRSHTIADYHDRSACLAAIDAFVEHSKIPRRLVEPIEQCSDELMMNALYDAPVDTRGARVFAGVPTRKRIAMRTEHAVAVQYACDARRFAIAVRDRFGSLDRETLVRHLHKALHDAQPIERKPGGAGLGLYLMVNLASAVHFHVLPGIATEVVCVFDLEPTPVRLRQLGFLVQHEARELRAAGPAHARLAAARRRRIAILAAATAGLVVLLGASGWWIARRLGDSRAIVELESQPPGALVTIDGRSMGTTPLRLTSLAPDSSVSISFALAGYRTASARLEVPSPGHTTRLAQPLALSDAFVRVRFVSNPPGAAVVPSGQVPAADRTYTPVELFLEVDKVQRFTLVMPGHAPLVIEPFTLARGATGVVKGGDLITR